MLSLNSSKLLKGHQSIRWSQKFSSKLEELDEAVENSSFHNNPDPGQVISTIRDLIALGEEVYQLVIKGKPTNTTNYSPVSVIPMVDQKPVDLLDTEGWKVPRKKSFEISFENFLGMEVIYFRYSVIYSYGGSYNGKGSYLTSVQIIPEEVRTLFGFDFSATMKLGGIQNQGTSKSPIAGATLLMEYTASSVLTSTVNVDSFYVNGVGNLREL